MPTGKGTDAQAGIHAIVHCGGTVFAQDQAGSASFGMPGAAIDTTLVTKVLAPQDVGEAIDSHVTRRQH